MRSRLNLNANQIKQLDDIMEATGRSFWEAKKRSDAEVKSLQEHQQAQIRAMLDPAQVAEYEKMLKEREERMRRDRERNPRRPQP
jgi:Spy/CpxP family protein refolding chaperone